MASSSSLRCSYGGCRRRRSSCCNVLRGVAPGSKTWLVPVFVVIVMMMRWCFLLLFRQSGPLGQRWPPSFTCRSGPGLRSRRSGLQKKKNFNEGQTCTQTSMQRSVSQTSMQTSQWDLSCLHCRPNWRVCKKRAEATSDAIFSLLLDSSCNFPSSFWSRRLAKFQKW